MGAVTDEDENSVSDRSGVLLDALPYVDKYDESDQSLVYGLLRKELSRKANAKKERLEVVPYEVSFQSEALKADWERVKESEGRNFSSSGVRTSDQRLVEPSASAPLEEWVAAVDQAKIQLEYLRNKKELLELLESYGANSWIAYNNQIELLKCALQEVLEEQERKIEQVNAERSTAQASASAMLERIWGQWREVVEKNVQIDASCQILKLEIDEMSKRKGAKDQNDCDGRDESGVET